MVSITNFKLRKYKGVNTIIIVKAECIFKISISGVRGTTFIIGDSNFFPRINIIDCVDSFVLSNTILIIISI